MATHYAWSDLYYGGKSEKRERSNGMSMTVVLERNVVKRGEKVTKAQLGVGDDEWDALVASGSVRDKPLPEGASEYVSPAQAVTQALVNDQGEIDVMKLIDMGFPHPPGGNAPDEEASRPKGA